MGDKRNNSKKMLYVKIAADYVLAATLLFKKPSFGTWIQTWGMNMPMALIWQMFYCGPLVRLIFRTLFRKQLQEQ